MHNRMCKYSNTCKATIQIEDFQKLLYRRKTGLPKTDNIRLAVPVSQEF